MNATSDIETEQEAASTPYWVELLDASVGQIQGRYRSRVLQAGDGPALFLLHGTGGHLENYVRNIRALSRHFHVIAPDFLWHGLSQTEGYQPDIIPALVDQVLDIADTLGVGRFHLEGQSLGGWVAMRLAISHPGRLRRLVLTTAMGYRPEAGAIPGYTEPDWKANLPSSLDMLDNPSFENVKARMSRILARPARLTDEAVRVRQALYQRPALAAVQRQLIQEYLGSGPSISRHVVRDEDLPSIQAPTLVYWGDKNRTPPALGLRLSRGVRNGRFHCAEDTGHWAQFESAEEHDRVVSAFLLAQDIQEGDER